HRHHRSRPETETDAGRPPFRLRLQHLGWLGIQRFPGHDHGPRERPRRKRQMDRTRGHRPIRRRTFAVGAVMKSPAMTNESAEVAGGKLVLHRRRPADGRSAGTVILLHPWFGCWQFWNRTVDALPAFEAISVDLYSLGDRADWREFAGPEGLAR